MSQTITARNYLQAMSRVRGEFAHTYSQLSTLAAENTRQVQDLEQRAGVALAELTAAILPVLSAEALSRAVQLSGYVPLVQNDPLAAMERTQAQLGRRIAEIEDDRRYRDRALLRAPRIGLLTREIDELLEFRAPLHDIVVRCAHERLDRLLQVGYDTPAYNVPFWRMSYYSDWQAADQICERFDKQKTFATLRADYLVARDTVAVYDTKLEKLQKEVRIGEALEEDYVQTKLQIEQLPETVLANVRGQLASYLRDIDLVAIGDRLAQESQIDGMAKRYLGLRKQSSYLRESGQHLLQNTTTPVVETMKNLDREIQKYQRPKLTYSYVPAEKMNRLRSMDLRRTKCQKQTERYQQTSVVVYSFDHYDRGRLDDDFLWWDLMAYTYSQRFESPQKVYANFIPEVAEFRASHPDSRYRPTEDNDFFVDAQIDAEADAAAASLDTSLDASEDRSIGSDIS